jgi:hypothetical protein
MCLHSQCRGGKDTLRAQRYWCLTVFVDGFGGLAQLTE